MPHPRILLAEDDALLAETVGDMLLEEGFIVTLAGDGLLALAAAEQAGFDALLTDIRMPNMDGVALIERMRADNPALPIVVMSAQVPSDLTNVLRRNGVGPSVTLPKPMSMRSLVDALIEVLGIEVLGDWNGKETCWHADKA
jgi:two-component system response regulator HydG